MISVAASQLSVSDVRKGVLRTIRRQANRLFGANTELFDAIIAQKHDDDVGFVADLFEVFKRYTLSRWKIRPE